MEWFEDDSFWLDFYPFIFSEERMNAAKEDVEKIVHLLDFKGSSVLDLCCGPGRYSLVFAEKGFSVTGVDRTTFLLARAIRRAEILGLEIEWVRQDMREFIRPGEFDLVLSMLTSFGYFDDKKDDAGVLENMFVSLREGGFCLIDLVGKEVLARVFEPTSAYDLSDGSVFIQRREIADDWTRIRNEWILVRGDKAKTHRFHLRLYSGQELRELLQSVGFGEIHLYGDLKGNPYGPKADRLVVVGRKA